MEDEFWEARKADSLRDQNKKRPYNPSAFSLCRQGVIYNNTEKEGSI